MFIRSRESQYYMNNTAFIQKYERDKHQQYCMFIKNKNISTLHRSGRFTRR